MFPKISHEIQNSKSDWLLWIEVSQFICQNYLILSASHIQFTHTLTFLFPHKTLPYISPHTTWKFLHSLLNPFSAHPNSPLPREFERYPLQNMALQAAAILPSALSILKEVFLVLCLGSFFFFFFFWITDTDFDLTCVKCVFLVAGKVQGLHFFGNFILWSCQYWMLFCIKNQGTNFICFISFLTPYRVCFLSIEN